MLGCFSSCGRKGKQEQLVHNRILPCPDHTQTSSVCLWIMWLMFWIAVPVLPYTKHPCEQCGSAGGQQNTSLKGGATHPRTAVLWPQKWSFVAHTKDIRVIHLNYFLVKGDQLTDWFGATETTSSGKHNNTRGGGWVRPAVLANLAVFSSNQVLLIFCVCPLHQWKHEL